MVSQEKPISWYECRSAVSISLHWLAGILLMKLHMTHKIYQHSQLEILYIEVEKYNATARMPQNKCRVVSCTAPDTVVWRKPNKLLVVTSNPTIFKQQLLSEASRGWWDFQRSRAEIYQSLIDTQMWSVVGEWEMIQVSLDLNSSFTYPRSCVSAGYRGIICRKRYSVAIWWKGNCFGAPHLAVKGMPPRSRDHVPEAHFILGCSEKHLSRTIMTKSVATGRFKHGSITLFKTRNTFVFNICCLVWGCAAWASIVFT